jgi:hypothetical protein
MELEVVNKKRKLENGEMKIRNEINEDEEYNKFKLLHSQSNF